ARDLITEQGISSSTRGAIAAALVSIHGCRSDTIALKAVAAAIVSGSVVIAVARQGWEPLLGGLGLIVLPVVGKWLRWRRIERLKERTFAVRAKPDFSWEKYQELGAGLEWDPISMLGLYKDREEVNGRP